MTTASDPFVAAGVPYQLAQTRRATITELEYRLSLEISATGETPMRGLLGLKFSLAEGADWPLIDFAPADSDAGIARHVLELRVDGRSADFSVCNGHIRIEAAQPRAGWHEIECGFVAGTAALHRRKDLVYTLFVPAHAHRVLPCFDQPDLKAPVELELTLPANWQCLANAPIETESGNSFQKTLRFRRTQALPTYLFAFIAGRLQIASASLDTRRLWLAAPLAASDALAGNLDAIAELHAISVRTLEQYTGIEYPFEQIGAAVIPDFEFGGMEHPGATFYRQGLVLLDAVASRHERMRRANLIAHEMAHMWFGNLVTMRWFDDVWLKEVFANFMADKIVAGLFPDIDATAAFTLRHWPEALAIDRTEGARAIRRKLDNLIQATELYDATIYHKAPIAIVDLERRIGPTAMRRGLSRYLGDFSFAAADWTDLEQRLQAETGIDIRDFSRSWLETAGPPGRDAGQGENGDTRGETGDTNQREAEAELRYGTGLLDEGSRERALQHAATTGDDGLRAAAWIRLYEDMLGGGIGPARLLTAAISILSETEASILAPRLLGDLDEIFWRYLPAAQRGFAAGPVERALHIRLSRSAALPHGPADQDRSATDTPWYWLNALCNFATTEATLAHLESVWHGDDELSPDLPESTAEKIVTTLALQNKPGAPLILEQQIARSQDPARRARLEFLAPAIAGDLSDRNEFFADLLETDHPARWSVAGLRLLNRAGRAETTRHYIGPGLQHAMDIHHRGELFFPRQWLTALLLGHGSPAAGNTIEAFIDRTAEPTGFGLLLLQVADPVLRAARIRSAA